MKNYDATTPIMAHGFGVIIGLRPIDTTTFFFSSVYTMKSACFGQGL
jgi:hypothetical protein